MNLRKGMLKDSALFAKAIRSCMKGIIFAGNVGMMTNLRYLDFYKQIDVDAVFDELGWIPEEDDGVEMKGFCFDAWGLHKHGDTTGKFAFNREKVVGNCFVCQGFTLQALVMAINNLDYQEATNWLFKFTKPSQKSSEEFYEQVSRLLNSSEPETKPMPFFNELVLDQWHPDDPLDYEWFSERNISSAVVDHFKCGFNPQAKSHHSKKEVYQGRAIILPHFWNKKLVGWQHRWLDERPNWVPKYENTSSFPRDRTVWGYDFCKVQDHQPIIVESVPTALMLISEGYPAIATFGASVSDAQIKLLRVFSQGILLARDNDEAGRVWEDKIISGLVRYVPILGVDPVKGSGNDLGDLEINELSTHLQSITYRGISL